MGNGEYIYIKLEVATLIILLYRYLIIDLIILLQTCDVMDVENVN